MAAGATPAAEGLRERHHPHCWACSPRAAGGLSFSTQLDDKGVAHGVFACDACYEGYPRMLHGGVISALLDCAMTNCLFLHGHVAYTAELVVRFRHPVLLETTAEVRAWIVEDSHSVFRLRAELLQAGVVKAVARAAFMVPGPLSELGGRM